MLYGEYAFAKDRNSMTMKPKKEGVVIGLINDKPGLSDSDVRRLNKLYECDGNPAPHLLMTNWCLHSGERRRRLLQEDPHHDPHPVLVRPQEGLPQVRRVLQRGRRGVARHLGAHHPHLQAHHEAHRQGRRLAGGQGPRRSRGGCEVLAGRPDQKVGRRRGHRPVQPGLPTSRM
ncbi:metalloendopeptidase [Caerostris extrusa]|uniref:Metalloendopeptidase n=1 Tax=Caerostris extrusa TaxID=172846 RepID=A0AAV4SDL0_CAEEX|nr:metalloendopeptidase [Caerostris extrusa]